MNRHLSALLICSSLGASALVPANATDAHPKVTKLHGRFGQAIGAGYRDICISPDGRSAAWLTKNDKDCDTCPEKRSAPVRVSYRGNGLVHIDSVDFDIIGDGTGLSHPSIGEFGSWDSGFDTPRPSTCANATRS
jgi:hypothetical protein